MRTTLSEKLQQACDALLQRAYAVNRRSGPDIDSMLYEFSVARDEPPSRGWVLPFLKLTVACARQIPGWSDATSDLVYFAGSVAPYLSEVNCEAECIAVYELLIQFLIENNPPRSSIHQISVLSEILAPVDRRDELIHVAIVLDEGLTRITKRRSEIRRMFNDWVSAHRGGFWSAQYILSAFNSVGRLSRNQFYKRADFRKGFEDVSLRQRHVEIGWPVLKQAFSPSDRDLILSLFA